MQIPFEFYTKSRLVLRGIFLASGTLADALVENQNADSFHTVFHPKVHSALHFHQLTTLRNYNLEFFIMFSSCSAILGAPGQSNHAAASRFLDSLANYRHSIGLTVGTIDWG